MKTALVLDGSGKNDGLCRMAGDLLISALAQAGAETERIALAERVIEPCAGRFSCWLETPGECVHKDDGSAIAEKAINCDFLFFLTPVVFGGYSSVLKKAVERLFPHSLPFLRGKAGEIHHTARYGRYPALAGIGVLEKPDEKKEKMFKNLLQRNSLNMHVPRAFSWIYYKDNETHNGTVLAEIRNLLNGFYG